MIFSIFLHESLFAEKIVIESRRRLLAGHRRRFIVEDDVRDVLAVFDRIGNGDLAAVKKSRVAHEDDLLVRDERVDAEPRCATQSHAAVIVHEVLVRLEHQHRVATGVAMENEIDRLAAMGLAHVFGFTKSAFDFTQDAGGITMRTAGAESRGARRKVHFDGLIFRPGKSELTWSMREIVLIEFGLILRRLQRAVGSRHPLDGGPPSSRRRLPQRHA